MTQSKHPNTPVSRTATRLLRFGVVIAAISAPGQRSAVAGEVAPGPKPRRAVAASDRVAVPGRQALHSPKASPELQRPIQASRPIIGPLEICQAAPELRRVPLDDPRVRRTSGEASSARIDLAAAKSPAGDRITSTVRAVLRGRACVVNIHSEKTSKGRDAIFNGGDRKVNGMGTGIVVDERGYIVTNYHVVQDTDSLRVTLYDGAAFDARLVSFDRETDLAIIRIPVQRPLAVMPLGTSSDLMLGEDVLAIGNAFGYEHSVTRGIISALHRDVDVNEEQSYKNLIQIDAAINPGNSGGPLLNRDGEVIGINVAIRAGAQRIGFAIPIDDARVRIARLLSSQKLSGLYHGVVTVDHKKARYHELRVTGIVPNSPAAAAGLQAGDLIQKVGSIATVDGADFERALLGRQPGTTVPVEVVRDGIGQTVSLRVLSRSGSARSYVPRKAAAPITKPDAVWQQLGMRLQPVDAGRLSQLGTNYRGGLVVTSVRPGSLAEENSIVAGDVLVGLHLWETVRSDNVDYVLRHPDLAAFNPVKFYVWRNGETLYGHFRLKSSLASR